jgi:beta-glucosidase
VKHYVFNNEESDRSGMSSNVPDRAARELYYKPFAAAVDAGVGSAMCRCVCSHSTRWHT